jgi:hypothetical protein
MASNQTVNRQTSNRLPVFAGPETTAFKVTHMPPNTRIYVYVDNVNITMFCSPLLTSQMGTEIVTNQQGEATGFLYIPSNDGQYKFLSGEILISFGDSPNGIENCTYIAESIMFNHGLNLIDTEQGSTISLRATEKFRTSTQGSSAEEDTSQQRLDPLSQTFVIEEVKYPQGIVVTSIVLYFFNKDSNLPVSVELRPTEGGIPSRTEYISGSTVTKYPQDIQIYDPTAGEAFPTVFTFTHPIYLKPGEYAFCVVTKSDQYQLVTAKLGDGKTVKKPFAGKLFRAQNTGTEWKEDTNEDLTFRINKAKFETGTTTFLMKNNTIAPIEYNKLRMLSTTVSLGDTAYAEYRVKTTSAGIRDVSDFLEVLPNGEPNLDSRQEVSARGDITLEVSLTTKSQDVAPILDKQLIKAQLFRNKIVPYSTVVSQSELSPNTGQAGARYIGKIVALQEGFDSTGLEVTVDVNRKIGTDIEVYARVLSREDKVLAGGIVERPWQLLPLAPGQSKSFAGTDTSSFSKEIYRLLDPDLSYSYNGEELATVSAATDDFSFDTFGYYQIKVVFYASNQNYLPIIKNLTATAVL